MRGLSSLTTVLCITSAASAWVLVALYGTPLHWGAAVLATAAVASLFAMERSSLQRPFDHEQIQAALGREIFRARRYQRPFAALIVDLAHVQADVAAQLGADVRALIRKTDEVGFWSEHELLLILSESRASDAASLADRIRKELIPVGVEKLRVGVTEYGEEDSIQRIVDRVRASLAPIEAEQNEAVQ
jgi:GGDEF domain-containing protein